VRKTIPFALLTVPAQIDFLEGRCAEAAKRSDEIRALEEKPAQMLICGIQKTLDKTEDGRRFLVHPAKAVAAAPAGAG
jgi:hypothetical protein